MTIEEKLRRRGWEEHEINRVMDILYSDYKKKKHIIYTKKSNLLIYWVNLFVLTIGNFLIAFILIPFLLTLKGSGLYLIIVILGIVFGTLFSIMIRDIEMLETKHHIFATIYIPLISILTLYIMVTVANNLENILGMGVQHQPLPVSILYAVVFVLPYILINIKGLTSSKSKVANEQQEK
jgi:hypothetical protein